MLLGTGTFVLVNLLPTSFVHLDWQVCESIEQCTIFWLLALGPHLVLPCEFDVDVLFPFLRGIYRQDRGVDRKPHLDYHAAPAPLCTQDLAFHGH